MCLPDQAWYKHLYNPLKGIVSNTVIEYAYLEWKDSTGKGIITLFRTILFEKPTGLDYFYG